MADMNYMSKKFKLIFLLGFLSLGVKLASIPFLSSGTKLGPLDDDGFYLRIGKNIVKRHEYTDGKYKALHPPLFPLFLASVYKVHGTKAVLPIRIYQCFLSMIVPFTCLFICCSLGMGWMGILFSFAFACFHPAFIHYAVNIQGDGLFIIFSTLACMFLEESTGSGDSVPDFMWGGIAGIFSGLATLGRSQFFFVPLIYMAVRRRWKIGALGTVLGMGLAMSPWIIRNAATMGYFEPFSTKSGFTLWVGNNPLATGGGEYDASHFKLPKGLSETDEDAFYGQMARSWIEGHPKAFLALSWAKFKRFWAIWPQVGNLKVKIVSGMAYGTLFFFVFMAFLQKDRFGCYFRHRQTEIQIILLVCLYYTLTHMIYPAVLRYRLTLEPLLICLAGIGVESFYSKLPLDWRLKTPFLTKLLD